MNAACKASVRATPRIPPKREMRVKETTLRSMARGRVRSVKATRVPVMAMICTAITAMSPKMMSTDPRTRDGFP